LATPQFIAIEAGQVREAGYQWTPLASLASALVAAGVTQVPGGIRGDDSAESQLRFLPVWPASYQTQEQIGLLSALSVNEGIQYTPPHTTLALDPPAYAASQLAQLLTGQNVAVTGGPDQAAPAKSVVLATVSSAPLSQIVESLIRASDDWIAELLTRAIDKASGGSGTTAGGVSVVLGRAQQAGIPLAGAHMDDGSGLSRTDRATCDELLSALNVAAQPAYAPVMAGLPVAAETGTLVGRFRGTPIVGKLQAKTGSLDGVAGLVGVVNGPATMRFAFVENDNVSETVLDAKQDAVVAAIATYAGIAGAMAHS
jgi:D-alanyl-D-alanine carboxypeptidase/D-alanyl-D-alanine-endopeptidase (penicillin-binding protein 4)